jgi:hypothetical protein
MSAPRKPPPSTLDEIREATREAHSAIKALRQAERDARAAQRDLEAAVMTTLGEGIQKQVDAGLTTYVKQLHVAIENHRETVTSTLSRLANRAMYGNEAGKGINIFDAMRAKLDGIDVDVHRDL